MNSPICFAQYFTNKQNVRSFSNIINLKLLKSENNADFVQKVIGDEELVRRISFQLIEILSELRQNIKFHCKHDFKEFLTIKENKYLVTVNKNDIFTSCCDALHRIIPYKFFNNNLNQKLFKKIIKIIIFSLNRQYFMCFGEIIERWNITVFPWNTMSMSDVFKIIYNILHWIFKTILSAIINLNFYVTTCKMDADENKLNFFWKSQWQSFYDKKIIDMVVSRTINRYEPSCSGKNVKKKYNLEERFKLKNIKKNTPKIHLVLKHNNEYRPIVRYKAEVNPTEKHKIKEKLNFLRTLTGKRNKKIEMLFQNLLINWLKKNKPQLYFIKSDLTNAFGSINKNNLLKILCEKHLEFQKAERPVVLKKKFAQSHREMVAELRQPLLIRAGSTIYEWTEGLVQGYKYSPAFSELYYTYFDNIYFMKHLNKENEMKLFMRVVDDYLYITDCLDDAFAFLTALSNYRNINYSKTIVNFQHPTIKCSQEITFLGYTYNTTNLQVSRANTVYSGQLCYKIGFSAAIVNLSKFLENRIGQTGIQINSHIFNFYYNEEFIWNHIFATLCLSANKFCTILAILCNERDMAKYLSVYKRKVTVKLCNRIIDALKRDCNRTISFKYCINHFRYLSYKALLLCARNTPKCNVLVPLVSVELAKTNCLSGKWQDHSSRINKNGQSQLKAVREVCRRSDLKLFMKKYDTLPEGFQCFDYKIFYQ